MPDIPEVDHMLYNQVIDCNNNDPEVIRIQAALKCLPEKQHRNVHDEQEDSHRGAFQSPIHQSRALARHRTFTRSRPPVSLNGPQSKVAGSNAHKNSTDEDDAQNDEVFLPKKEEQHHFEPNPWCFVMVDPYVVPLSLAQFIETFQLQDDMRVIVGYCVAIDVYKYFIGEPPKARMIELCNRKYPFHSHLARIQVSIFRTRNKMMQGDNKLRYIF